MRTLTIRCIIIFLVLVTNSSKVWADFAVPVKNGVALSTTVAYGMLNSATIAPVNTIDQEIKIKSRTLYMKLDMGDVYKLGKQAWSADLVVIVNFKKGTQVLRTEQIQLTVNNATPESYKILEYRELLDATSVEILKVSYSNTSSTYSGSAINTKIRLTTNLIDNFGKGTSARTGASIIPQNTKAIRTYDGGTVSGSKLNFSWTIGAGQSFDSYDLQVLKVEPYADGSVMVDWNKAPILEVNALSYEMTMAEGTGFYIWRVRPVGSYYEDGRAFWKNLGTWSAHITDGLTNQLYSLSGTTLVPTNSGKIVNNEMTGVSGGFFYYQQFDEDKNFTYSKNLTENSRQAESISYANGLNQLQQTQTRIFSQQQVVAGQTVYDYVGRPTLQSLAAPLSKNSLGYSSTVFNPLGQTRTYNASDFDTDANLYNPSTVNTSSAVGKYYSDANTTNTYVPDAEGYPFTRSEFFPDPMGVIHRSSMPGDTKRIDNSANSKNTLTFFDAVSQDELDAVFGSEAPLEHTVYKEIVVDPNKVTAVTYRAYSGEVLATCLDNAVATDLLPLGNERSVTVKNVFPKGVVQSETRFSSTSKPFTVTNPTGMTVGLNYTITPQSFALDCESICKSCDYRVEIKITSVLEPTVRGKNLIINFKVNPKVLANCDYGIAQIVWGSNLFNEVTYTEPSTAGGSPFGFTNGTEVTSINLPQGTYMIEKKVYVDNKPVNAFNSYLDLAKLELINKAKNWTLNQNCCGPHPIEEPYVCGEKPAFCEPASDLFVTASDPDFVDFVNTVLLDFEKEQDPVYKTKVSNSLVSGTLWIDGDATTSFTKTKDFLIELNSMYSCQQISDCYLGASAALNTNVLKATQAGAVASQNANSSGGMNTSTNATSGQTPPAEYNGEFDMVQALFDCLGYKRGLTGDYFYSYSNKNRTFEKATDSKLLATRNDLIFDFNWFNYNQNTRNTPVAGIPSTTSNDPRFFGVRWTGFINIPSTVTALKPYYNDGVRVWIDEHMNPAADLDDWVEFGTTRAAGEETYAGLNYTTKQFNVTPGKHKIKIEFFQYYNDASFKLKWINGGVEEIVPYQNLYPKNDECSGKTKLIVYNDPAYQQTATLDPDAVYVFFSDKYSGLTIDQLSSTTYSAQKACLYTYFKDVPLELSAANQTLLLSQFDPYLSTSLSDAISKVCECVNAIPQDAGANSTTIVAAGQDVSVCNSGCESKRSMFQAAIDNVVEQANMRAGIFDPYDPERLEFEDLFPGQDLCCLLDMLVEECKQKCTKPNLSKYLDIDKMKAEAAYPQPYAITIDATTHNFSSYQDFLNSTLFYDLLQEDYRNFELGFIGAISVANPGNYTKGGDLLYVEKIITETVYQGMDKALRDKKATDTSDPDKYISETEYAFIGDLSDAASTTPINRAGKIQVHVEWDPNVAGDGSDDQFIKAEINLYIAGTLKEQFVLNGLPSGFFSGIPLATRFNVLKFYFDNQHQIHIVPKSNLLSYCTYTSNLLNTEIDADRRIILNGGSSQPGDKLSIILSTPTGMVDLSGTVEWQSSAATTAASLADAVNTKKSSPDFTASIDPVHSNELLINIPSYSHTLPVDHYDISVDTDYPTDFTVDAAWRKPLSLVDLLQAFGTETTYNSTCPYGYELLGPAYGSCGNEIDENYYHIGNSPQRHADGSYIMTNVVNPANALEYQPQSRTLVSKNTISLNTSFELHYKVFLGSKNQFGADGLLFALAPSSFSNQEPGGQLGYFSATPGVFANSLGIEFDTYVNDYEAHNYGHSGFQDLPAGETICSSVYSGFSNSGNCIDGSSQTVPCGFCKDIDYDHITVWQNKMGTRYQPGGTPIPTVPIKYSPTSTYQSVNVEDGQYHDVRLIWSPAPDNTLKVYFDGDLRTTVPIDPSVVFGTTNVYYGWQGTCALTNDQRIIPKPTIVGSSCSICARWEKVTEQDVNIVTSLLGDEPEIVPITCESAKQSYIENETQAYLGNCLDNKLAELAANYKTNCLDHINDEFSLTYTLGYHHYTLHYYDRAGNHIKTVPPDGVDFITEAARLAQIKNHRKSPVMYAPVFPLHTMATTYSYNSLNQKTSSTHADGGKERYWYDAVGQLVLNQTAEQAATSAYTYAAYDNLGRIVEKAKLSYFNPTFIDSYHQVLSRNFSLSGVKEEQTQTVYSTAGPVTYGKGFAQRNLINRLSYTTTKNKTGLNVITYFSYDPHGNVEWTIQDIGGLVGRKTLRYEYDLVSGNPLKVYYQEGKTDQFIHKYEYEEDNRIRKVYTSTDDISWTTEAGYTFYPHGALARTEIGQDKIQGSDYIYTIEGFLKSINQVSLNTAKDPGQDNGSLNGYLQDEFAMELTYYDGDYRRTGIEIGQGNASINSSISSEFTNLYNGNIAAWTTNTRSGTSALTTTPYGMNIRQFKYDKLNRIKSSVMRDFNGSGVLNTIVANQGKETFSYTGNGNITHVDRWNYAGTKIDELDYAYLLNPLGSANDAQYLKNQLTKVTDASPTQGTSDIQPGQTNDNYLYDFEGNLKKDAQEGITITWNVYNKVATVLNEKNTANKTYLTFDYDGFGNRIRKTYYTHYGTAQQDQTVTSYVNDASGNVMSVYKQTPASTDLIWSEVPLYGSSRLGIYQPEKVIPAEVYDAGTAIQNFDGTNSAPYVGTYGTYAGPIANPSATGINTSANVGRVTKGWWGNYVMYDISKLQLDLSQPIRIDFRKEFTGTHKVYVELGDNPTPTWGWADGKFRNIYSLYSADITGAANTWQTVTFTNPEIKENTLNPAKLKYLYVYIDPDNNTLAAYQKNIWLDNIRATLIQQPCADAYKHTSEQSNWVISSLPEKDYTGIAYTELFNAEDGVTQNATLTRTLPWTGPHVLYKLINPEKEGSNQSEKVWAYGRGTDVNSGIEITLGSVIADASVIKFNLDAYDLSAPSALTLKAYAIVSGVEQFFGTYYANTDQTNKWHTVEFILDPSTANMSFKNQVIKLYLYTDQGVSYKTDQGELPILNFDNVNSATYYSKSTGLTINAPFANPAVGGVNTSANCLKVTKSGLANYIMYNVNSLPFSPSGQILIDVYKTAAVDQTLVVMFGTNPTPDWTNVANRYINIRTEYTKVLTTTNQWTTLAFTSPTTRNAGVAAQYMYIFFAPDDNTAASNGNFFYVDNIVPTSTDPILTPNRKSFYYFDNFAVLPANAQPLVAGGKAVSNNGTTFTGSTAAGRLPQQIPSGQLAVAENNTGDYAFTFLTTNVFNADLPSGQHGLKAKYYDASNVLKSQLLVPEVNYSWTRGQDPFFTGQNFRALYEGYVYAPENGSYTFSIPGIATGTGSLTIDGTVVWQKVTTGAGTYSVNLTLTPGFHSLSLNASMIISPIAFSELKLLWTTPNDKALRVISKQYLYQNNTLTANHAAVDVKHGLKTTIYNGSSDASPVLLTRQDPTVNASYASGSLVAPGLTYTANTIPFATKWEGYLFAPYAGTYTFYYTNSTGSSNSLDIDGVSVFALASTATRNTTLYLTQGVHRIKAYAQHISATTATCKLEWKIPLGPGGAPNYTELIPSQFLYTDEPTVSYLYDQVSGTAIDLLDPNQKIEASEQNQIITAPVPESSTDHYLITGKDGYLYYHRISKQNGVLSIVSKNNKINWNIGAGNVPAQCEDYALASYVNSSKEDNNKLFIATKDAWEGNYRLLQFNVFRDQLSYNTSIIHSASGCVDLSEAQISPNGTRLMVNIAQINSANTTEWLHRFVEYSIQESDVATAFVSYRDLYSETRDQMYYGTDRMPRSSILSFDYSPDSRYIYYLIKNRNTMATWGTAWYNKVYSGAVGVNMGRYETGTTPSLNAYMDPGNWFMANSLKVSIRRAVDGKLYVTRDNRSVNLATITTAAAKQVIILTGVNYGQTLSYSTTLNVTAGAVLGGSLPLQAHRVQLIPCSAPNLISLRKVGSRVYELIDHLSNIRAVVGDTRLATVASNDVVSQSVDVYSFSDYYAFGMNFRQYTSNNYRYGFNGQEKDNEIPSTGNSYTAEYWQYDARLGRRWNLDPVIKYWESPYACFNNNPIWVNDIKGDDGDKTVTTEKEHTVDLKYNSQDASQTMTEVVSETTITETRVKGNPKGNVVRKTETTTTTTIVIIDIAGEIAGHSRHQVTSVREEIGGYATDRSGKEHPGKLFYGREVTVPNKTLTESCTGTRYGSDAKTRHEATSSDIMKEGIRKLQDHMANRDAHPFPLIEMLRKSNTNASRFMAGFGAVAFTVFTFGAGAPEVPVVYATVGAGFVVGLENFSAWTDAEDALKNRNFPIYISRTRYGITRTAGLSFNSRAVAKSIQPILR
jgi:hypothetical protein